MPCKVCSTSGDTHREDDCLLDALKEGTNDAYETLILDALQGDASLFTRADEVEEAWSIVDPIIESWATSPAPDVPDYDAGTWGPDAADALLARDGRRWRRF